MSSLSSTTPTPGTPIPDPDQDTDNTPDLLTVEKRGGARNNSGYAVKKNRALLDANINEFLTHFECGCVCRCGRKVQMKRNAADMLADLRHRRFRGAIPCK